MGQDGNRTPGSIPRFENLVLLWADLEEEERQELVNHWSVAFTLEDLKDLGLVEGNCEIDLPVARMMFGFAVANGYSPTDDTNVIEEHARMMCQSSNGL